MTITASSFNGMSELDSFLKANVIEGGGSFDDNGPMQFFNKQLALDFNPDINGFSLCFFIPPPFLGLDETSQLDQKYIDFIRLLVVFSAMDFTPPVRQVQLEKASARTGGIAYATEVEPSDQCSVSYVDNTDLDIFNFHSCWIDYMHDLMLGYIEVPAEYLSPGAGNYGALDYAGSIYIVRYDFSMKNILYVGKCTGVYPTSLPNKEIIGQRSSNELSVIPITYSTGWYEETFQASHPIISELHSDVISKYS